MQVAELVGPEPLVFHKCSRVSDAIPASSFRSESG
jgi:hypothetical protein